MNDPIELPSLQEIEQMEKQRSQAIEALEIFDHSVKCQRCGIAVPIVGKLKFASIHGGRIGNSTTRDDDLKALKQEVADLQEEDAKYDKLRSLPLYSCKITYVLLVTIK